MSRLWCLAVLVPLGSVQLDRSLSPCTRRPLGSRSLLLTAALVTHFQQQQQQQHLHAETFSICESKYLLFYTYWDNLTQWFMCPLPVWPLPLQTGLSDNDRGSADVSLIKPSVCWCTVCVGVQYVCVCVGQFSRLQSVVSCRKPCLKGSCSVSCLHDS